MKKIFSYILIVVMVLFDLRCMVISISNNDFSRINVFVVLIPLLLIPKVLKLFKFKISDGLELMYYTFVFLAQFLGSVMEFYAKISWFDTFTHLLSGIFFSIISLLFIDMDKIKIPKKGLFFIIYVLGFTMLTASLWEFFEFGMDVLTKSNLQHSIETGVKDTMVDMIAAFLGSTLYITYYRCIKQK